MYRLLAGWAGGYFCPRKKKMPQLPPTEAGAFPSFRVSRLGGLRERIAKHFAVEHIASGIRRIYAKRILISATSSALTLRGGFLKMVWNRREQNSSVINLITAVREMTTMPLRKTVGIVLVALGAVGLSSCPEIQCV